MIDATYLKAHQTAPSLAIKKGAWTSDWAYKGRHEYETARHQPGLPTQSLRHSRLGQGLYRRESAGEQFAKGELAAW